LISRVDTILTGVGSFHQWTDYCDELVSVASVKQHLLVDVALGDLGGALIPLRRLEMKTLRAFAAISGLWTGIRRVHFKTVAKRAAATESIGPGVIVVAMGANKAAILYEVIRQGLVNHLIIDEDLAESLNQHCQLG